MTYTDKILDSFLKALIKADFSKAQLNDFGPGEVWCELVSNALAIEVISWQLETGCLSPKLHPVIKRELLLLPWKEADKFTNTSEIEPELSAPYFWLADKYNKKQLL